MKCSVLVLLLGLSSAYAASLYGGANVNGQNGEVNANPNGMSANFGGPAGSVNVQTKIKHFKGSLFLFAPQSWIDTFNAIPEAGQECLLTVFSDPANAAVAQSSDTEQAKQLVASKCPENTAQINAFFDATDATIKSLPESFTNQLKAYGEQAKQFGEQLKAQAAQRGAAGASQGAAAFGQANGQGANDAFRTAMSDYKRASIQFVQSLAALGQDDRQKIATAFPKLTPFLTGPNADNFLKELQELMTTLSASSGQPDMNALRSAGQEFKAAMGNVWNDYKTQNADGLRQASELFGTDLSNAFQSGSFARPGGFGGMSGPMNGGAPSGSDAMNNFREKFAEKRDEMKERLAAAWNNAKENGKEKMDQFKEAAAARGFNVGSAEKNSASVDVETH